MFVKKKNNITLRLEEDLTEMVCEIIGKTGMGQSDILRRGWRIFYAEFERRGYDIHWFLEASAPNAVKTVRYSDKAHKASLLNESPPKPKTGTG